MGLWKIPVGLWKIPVSSPRNYCVNCCKKQKATFGPKDFEKLKTNSQSKDKCCQNYPKDLITRINWFLCFSCMGMTSSKRSNEALDACQLHAFWSVLRPVHDAVLLSDVGCWQNCCRGDETYPVFSKTSSWRGGNMISGIDSLMLLSCLAWLSLILCTRGRQWSAFENKSKHPSARPTTQTNTLTHCLLSQF